MNAASTLPALDRCSGERREFVGVAQGPHALDALDVHDVGTGGHADLHGLAERVAQLDEQRQAPVADRGRSVARWPYSTKRSPSR